MLSDILIKEVEIELKELETVSNEVASLSSYRP
jgi:hypothetical protein